MSVNQQDVLDRGILYAKGLPTGLRAVPHGQEFADEIHRRFAPNQVSTYPTHSPTPDRALDSFPKSRALGDKQAEWSARPEVMARYGIDYVIWSFDGRVGSINNPEVAPGWRKMRDRGSPTANHVDHNHDSFNSTAPHPTPDPQPEEEPMLYIVSGSGSNYVTDLVSSKITLATEGEIAALISTGAKDARGSVPASVVDRIPLGDA